MSIEQLRSYRLFGYALFDFVATYVGAYLISKQRGYNTWNLFLILVLVSIPIHHLTDQDTKLMKDLKNRQPVVLGLTLLAVYYLWQQHQQKKLL